MKRSSFHRSLPAFIISAIALVEMATDMYLPNLPAVVAAFNSSEALLQVTLSANLLGLATAGLVAGPLSDSVGRRRTLLTGLLIFLIGGLGCMLAPTVNFLIGSRLLQGLGGGVILVVGMASIRDQYHAERLAKIMSLMGMVIALSPGIAPLIGGYIGTYFGWRATFAFLAVCGLVLLGIALRALPETLNADQRKPWAIATVAKSYFPLLKIRPFLFNSLLLALTIAQLWVEMGNLPFLFIQALDVPSQHYGIYFGSNVMVFILGTLFNQRCVMQYGVNKMLLLGIILKAVSVFLVLTMVWFDIKHPWLVQSSFFPGAFGLALVIGNAFSRSLSAIDDNVGAASAFMTLLQMLFAALALSLVGLFFSMTLWPIVIAGLIWVGLVSFLYILQEN